MLSLWSPACLGFAGFFGTAEHPAEAQSGASSDRKTESRHLSGKHSAGQFCVLTMADDKHRAKYEQNLRSHACYAKRHGYISAIEDCLPFADSEKGERCENVSPTLRKHDELKKWAADDRCDWLVWLDGDMFIADYMRPLSAFVPTDDTTVSVIMKDDTNIINNGMFMLRNSHWLRNHFLPTWRSLDFESKGDCNAAYPFTDNGSMLEVLMRMFIPGYEGNECGAPGLRVWANQTTSWRWRNCINQNLYETLGPTCLRPKDCSGITGRSGPTNANHTLLLRHPLYAFNYHGCDQRGISKCDNSPQYWTGIAKEPYYLDGKPLGDRFLDFMFVPPVNGKAVSFSLHSKTSSVLGGSFIQQVIAPRDVDCGAINIMAKG